MIIRFDEIEKKIRYLKKIKKRIVLCHGVFDLLHYGHIKHLEEAKKQGDILIVSITHDKYIDKNPNSPIYDFKKRSFFLNNLSFVDYVIVTPYPSTKEIIKIIKPDVFCKGKEYKDIQKHYNKNIINDKIEVEKYGGKIKFIGDPFFSSTKISKFFYNDDYSFEGKQDFSFISDIFLKISKLNVLVIGEIIFDNYKFVELLGIASKSSIISSKLINEETYFGGAGAVYNHIKEFVNNISLVSITGDENKFKKIINKNISKKSKIFFDKKIKSILKQRYVRYTGSSSEIEKLFSVNDFENINSNNFSNKKIKNYLNKNIKKFDLVIVCDYGHGLFDKDLINLIQKSSKFLTVNCQTNSYNFGTNILNNKYNNVDSFVLDQKEINLCFSKQINDNHSKYLIKLKKQLRTNNCWLTLGSKFSIGVNKNNKTFKIPPLAKNVIDPTGAGDAFFSISSLLSYFNIDINLSTFISQVAGSLSVKSVGNKFFLNRNTLLSYIKFYLK